MATVVVEAAEPEPSGSIANPAASTSPSLSHRFLDSKFYLLVVVGEIVTEEHLRRAIGNIELGKRPRSPSGTAGGGGEDHATTRPHPGRDRHLPAPARAPHPAAPCNPPFASSSGKDEKERGERGLTGWGQFPLILRDLSAGWILGSELATALMG